MGVNSVAGGSESVAGGAGTMPLATTRLPWWRKWHDGHGRLCLWARGDIAIGAAAAANAPTAWRLEYGATVQSGAANAVARGATPVADVSNTVSVGSSANQHPLV